MDFGLVDCGGPAATKTYTLTNTGPVPITYSARVPAGSAFAIQGASAGTVDPGAMASIALAATVASSSTAGIPITDTLTLTTDVPGYTSVPVELKATPQGGSLTVSPAPAAFGPVQLTTQAPDIGLTITNVGNAPVSLTVGAPSDAEYAVEYAGAPAAATLAAGATLPGAVARFHPTSAGPTTATAALQATGAMCASAASAVSMSGTGTTAPVSASPNPADFGTVPCGTTGKALPVTITNGYSFAITYSATLGATTASPFSLDSSSAGTVAANGQAVIQVTPKAVPVPSSTAPDAINDTLTVTTNAPSTAPLTVALTESASGAILAVDMPNTAFGPVAANTLQSLPFTVTNTGNVDAPLTLASGGAGFGAVFTGGTTTAAAGSGNAPGNATFSPSAVGPANGSLIVSTSAPLCAAPPPAIALTASGTAPSASTPTTSVSFTGDYQMVCGSTSASPTQTVTITNNGDAPLTLSGVQSQSGYFNVVSYTTTSIAPGNSGTITLQVPAPTKDANGVYNVAGGTHTDALLYTTNEVGSPTHSIPVTVVVVGANLSWVADANGTPLQLPIQLNNCISAQDVQYGVANSGNVTVYVSGPAGYPDEPNERFGGTFSSLQAVAAGTTVLDTVGHVAQNCTSSDSLTFTVAGSATATAFVPPTVCIPLPPLVIDATIPMTEGCPYCC